MEPGGTEDPPMCHDLRTQPGEGEKAAACGLGLSATAQAVPPCVCLLRGCGTGCPAVCVPAVWL